MSQRTTPRQRQEFYARYLAGETFQQIADSDSVSLWTVRYWYRVQRDGGGTQSRYRRVSSGLLSQFDPKVRYCVLRLRLAHPRRGPGAILLGLKKRPSLRGLKLPSVASIGRYLHQWAKFRRARKQKLVIKKPNEPDHVHQRWQIDFKMGIALKDGTLLNLHTVRDPVGEVCIHAKLFAAGKVGGKPANIVEEHVRVVLREAFARWGTLPEEVQTDGETVLSGRAMEGFFPTRFTLWLQGLGIRQLQIRPGKPTDNAEVERCHRTLCDYAIAGNERLDPVGLQRALDEALHELAAELPSRAEGCHGKPPLVAHPELLQAPRPFRPEHELSLFDLKRVDAYLAAYTWHRKVNPAGQVAIGKRRYLLGRLYKGRQVDVTFDARDRHFVFTDPELPEAEQELGRCRARGLETEDLTGLARWPASLGPQQLPLPLPMSEG